MKLNFLQNNTSFQEQNFKDSIAEKYNMRFQNMEQKTSKETNLNLTTKQGDIVTLSAFSDMQSQYTTYSNLTKTDTAYSKTDMQTLNFNFSSAYEISVQGDLNKEEMDDINKIIKTLDLSMNHLINGDAETALSQALELNGLETISGFEASMMYYSRNVYEYQEQTSQIDQAENIDPDLEATKSILEKLTEELAEKAKSEKDQVFSSVQNLFKDLYQKIDQDESKQNKWGNFLEKISNNFEKQLFNS